MVKVSVGYLEDMSSSVEAGGSMSAGSDKKKKDSRPLMDGGLVDMARDSGVAVKLFGEREAPQQEVTQADVSTDPARLITTERGWLGRKMDKVLGKEEVFIPEIKEVKPEIINWWVEHSKRVLSLFPDPKGPPEQHPFRYEWQMARFFMKTDKNTGQISTSEMRKNINTYLKDHPDFYNTSMLFIEFWATMKEDAVGLQTFMNKRGLGKDILDPTKPGKQEKFLARRLWHAMPQLPVTSDPKLIAGAYALEGSAFLALNMINFAIQATGNNTLALQNAVQNIVTTANQYGAGVAIGAAGIIGGHALGKYAVGKIVSAFRERGEMNVLWKVCEEGLENIKKDENACDWMGKFFGVNPKDLQVDTSGKLEFFDPVTGQPGGGTSSDSIRGMQGSVDKDIKLRELFLTKMVGLDRRSNHWANREFDEVHGLTVEFITRVVAGGSELMVANQTKSIYIKDWLLKFREMRLALQVPLDPDHKSELQEIFMKAGRALMQERSDAIFQGSGAMTEVFSIDDDPSVAYSAQNIQNKIDKLVKKDSEVKGVKVDKDGEDRELAKKNGEEEVKRARNLLEGTEQEGGTPKKDGLLISTTVLQNGKAGVEGGILDRRLTTDDVWNEVYTEVNAQYGALGRQAYEQQNIGTLDAIIVQIQKDMDKIDSDNDKLQSTGLKKVETDRKKALDEVDKLHKGVVMDVDAITKEKNRVDAQYDTKKADIEKQIAKQEAKKEKLGQMKVSIHIKREKLRKEYTALQIGSTEVVKVETLVEDMLAAYNKIGPPVNLLTQDQLTAYGTTGHRYEDYCTNFNTIAGANPRVSPWVPGEDVRFENQRQILYAVAEARALSADNTLHGVLGADHQALLNPIIGGLTSEQLMLMSPYEVHDRVADKLGWVKGTYDTTQIQSIHEAKTIETKRYLARQKALEETVALQRLVVAHQEEQLKKIDEDCDTKRDRLELVRHIVTDRATVLSRSGEFCTTRGLLKYTDLDSINISAQVTTEHGREAYSFAERSSGLSRGFIELMRDIFHYERNNMQTPARDAEGKPTGTTIQPDINNVSPDRLFNVLMSSLGANPPQRIANMIVESFPDFQDDVDGVFDHTLDPLRMHLTFDQVMVVLDYRSRPHAYPPPPPLGALALPSPMPVRPGEMNAVLSHIITKVANTAEGSG